jgi:hypothetical protein
MRHRHYGRILPTAKPISCSSACGSTFTRSAQRPFNTKSSTLRAILCGLARVATEE